MASSKEQTLKERKEMVQAEVQVERKIGLEFEACVGVSVGRKTGIIMS